MNLNDLQHSQLDLQHSLLNQQHAGIKFECDTVQSLERACCQFQEHLDALALAKYAVMQFAAERGRYSASFHISAEHAGTCAKDYDTLQLCQRLKLDTHNNTGDLQREIILAMLLSPVPFHYPSFQEFASALNIRRNIVLNARKTALAFATEAAERPAGYWAYHEDTGFTLLPGKSLIEALQKATQPDESGKLYSFSCYRATEYVILLSIAQELSQCNPELYLKLQGQWEKQAIMSGKFHDVFLHEYGSMEQPLPPRYYVPGDRLWFRNPDEHSSDATGYEGSWVFYLGNGQFTNFWKYDEPYTLVSKCVEIFHWRNAAWRDASGALQIDENKVKELVHASMNKLHDVAAILDTMLRLREPKGVYLAGGCIDTSREYPRLSCPGTSNIAL